MTLKHTPGPWEYAEHTREIWADKIRLATLTRPNSEIDARLISAAPDLLAALQEIRIFAEDALNDPGYDRDHILSRIFDATAIVRKATGEL